MKLVEILAEEMEEWPVGVTHLTQSNVDREIYNALDGKKESSVCSLNPRFDTRRSHSEGSYPIVTEKQWQAERDRQKGGEWRRHRGGAKPVDEGTWVEVKLRCGDIQQGLANAFLWRHADCDVAANIMQYRVISQPQAEEVEVNMPNAKTLESMDATDRGEGRTFNSAQDLYAALDITSKAKTDQIDGPIKWRDCVNELDAYIEKFTRERDELIERLASEGFALIPPVVSVVSDFAGVDMSDWRSWEVGDVIKVIANTGGHAFAIGEEVIVIGVDTTDRTHRIEATARGNDWWLAKSDGEFVRRP